MAEPALSPCAEAVRAADPDMFLAAMFAPEPLRERLMVLIAFDIELSRAVHRRAEPVIAAMRLQWWRDVVAEAVAGAPPREHEVARPLALMIRGAGLCAGDLDPMIAGREIELDAPFTPERFDAWAAARFGGLLAAGCRLAAVRAERAAQVAGRAMAVSFALRHARAMAGEGVYLLPMAGLDRAALSRAETTPGLRSLAAGLAGDAIARRRALPRRGVPGRAKPVLRLGWRSWRQLRTAQKPDLDLARDFLNPPGGAAPRLTWMALSGGW
ncbi:MAG: squalene/phytoene synthase family protein [Pseudomonadota bacterium]